MLAAVKTRPVQMGMNPMQLHLVSMLNFNNSEEAQERLERALLSFYNSEFERTKAEMFASGELTEEMIEEGAKRHFRTTY